MRSLSTLLANLGGKKPTTEASDDRNSHNNLTKDKSKRSTGIEERTERWSWASLQIRRRGWPGKRGNGNRASEQTWNKHRKGVAGTSTETENHSSTWTGDVKIENNSTAPASASASHPHETNKSEINTETQTKIKNEVEAETLQEPGVEFGELGNGKSHATALALVSTYLPWYLPFFPRLLSMKQLQLIHRNLNPYILPSLTLILHYITHPISILTIYLLFAFHQTACQFQPKHWSKSRSSQSSYIGLLSAIFITARYHHTCVACCLLSVTRASLFESEDASSCLTLTLRLFRVSCLSCP